MQTQQLIKDESREQTLETTFGWMKSRYPRLYLALAYHRTTSGKPMSFRDRTWLRAIYKDNSRHLVFMKCVQIGITELCIVDMFMLAMLGKRGLYLLPDDGWVGLWVKDRIDGLLERVPYYRAAVRRATKESDSTRLKSIFGQIWKYAGTHSKTAAGDPKHAHEFSAEALIIDEYDEHDPDDLNMFYDRLAASKAPYVRLLGNPSIEGRGISDEFNKTDAKKWTIPCHCGHSQVLEWEKHFVEEISPGVWRPRDKERIGEVQSPDSPFYNDDLRPVCEECKEPFDRTATGVWEKTNLNGAIGSGYAISRMFILVRPNDIRLLYKKFIDAGSNQSLLQEFNNKWLGRTYTNSNDALSEEILNGCMTPYSFGAPELPWEGTIAGIDQGKDFHIIISEVVEGKPRAIFIGRAFSWEQVNSLLDTHGVTYACADAQGGGYFETREFVRTRDGAWMVYYRPKDQVKELFDEEQEEGILKTNRTEILDAMVDSFRTGKQILPENWRSLDDGQFFKQMLVPQRLTDARGLPYWSKGNDHYFHAAAYQWVCLLASGIENSREPDAESWRLSYK